MKIWRQMSCLILLTAAVIFLFPCACRNEEKRIELIFWHGLESQESIKVLKDKIDQFEKIHPNIRIKAEHYGAADQVKAKIMTAIAGDKPPDLFWWGPQGTGLLARSGALLDLRPFIEKDEKDKRFDRSRIYSSLWDMCIYEKAVYAVPFDANNLGLYYNKAHFKDAGIDPAKLKNWSDLLAAAKKLTVDTDKDGRAERYGLQIPLGHSEWTVWVWQTFLWQAGGEFLNPEASKTRFNSPAGREALQFWVDLVHESKVAKFSESDAGYKTDDFLAGRVSMMINGPWNFKLLAEAKQTTKLEYGALPLPGKKTFATNIGGENLFVFKTDPAKNDGKWEFSKFILSADFQTEWAIETGYLPVNQDVLEEETYRQFLESNAFIKVYNQQMPLGRTRPTIPAYPEISDILGRKIEKALYREIPVEKALADAARMADKSLARQ